MTHAMAHHGLTHEQYSRLPGWSASHLRALRQGSPLHLRHHLDSPDEDTASRGMLRAVHAHVLEPHRIGIDFARYEGRRSGHAWEAWRDGQADRTILSGSEWDTAEAIARAVLAHPEARALLTGRHGLSELSVTWTDDESGLPCRGRLDRIQRRPDGWAVVDLKTVDSVADHRVRQLVGQHGWHVQIAHYVCAADALQRHERVGAYLVTVEQRAPHDVAVWRMEEDMLAVSMETRRDLLATIAECERSGVWPGRYSDVRPLSLPRYLMPDDDGMSMEVVDG